MSFKAVAWMLLAVLALAAVLLLNYWAAYQPLSTLAYFGIVLALCGLANLAFPFRFLGVRKRAAGALLLAAGAGLTAAALLWPAPTIRVARPETRLDEIMPEYQFSERHSARIHAPPEQVLEAVRQSTFRDMKSLLTLLKIREVVLRAPAHAFDAWLDKPVLEAFTASGYLSGGRDREIGLFSVVNVVEQRRPDMRTVQDIAGYHEPGAVKMAFDFVVDDAGGGWSTITAETRVLALGDVSRGMARYWRLIVPGSGLLRLQWLEGIRRRAESLPGRPS